MLLKSKVKITADNFQKCSALETNLQRNSLSRLHRTSKLNELYKAHKQKTNLHSLLNPHFSHFRFTLFVLQQEMVTTHTDSIAQCYSNLD